MAARVEPGTVVTIDYELRSSDGELLDEPGATVAYLHGGYGGIFPRIEAALEVLGTVIDDPNVGASEDLVRLVVRYTDTRSRIVTGPLPVDDPRRRRPDISRAQRMVVA